MLQKNLLNWYQINKRNLPWRETKDPYTIWLSEIILQQTRVSQGLPYFLRFIEAFPRVQDMANAHEDQVLKLWQGLGYYSRGRNMHATARLVCEKFNGIFPKTYAELIQLKGIGPYTAAAIASFSGEEAVAVLDGNVFRVLSRLHGVALPINSSGGKKVFEELAQEFLNIKQPGTHNQAIMELGALTCLPKKPDCENCPLQKKCVALATGSTANFPVKEKKLKVKSRFHYYFRFENKGRLAIYKRPKGSIWQHLFDLPLVVSDHELSSTELRKELTKQFSLNLSEKQLGLLEWQTLHILTHQRINAFFYRVSLQTKNLEFAEPIVWVEPQNIKDYAVSRLFDKYIEKHIS